MNTGKNNLQELDLCINHNLMKGNHKRRKQKDPGYNRCDRSPKNKKDRDRRYQRDHSDSSDSSDSRSRQRSRDRSSSQKLRRDTFKGRSHEQIFTENPIEPQKLSLKTIGDPLQKIQLTLRAGQQIIQKKSTEQEIPIVLRLKCLPLGESVQASSRPGIDLICVVDTSGSMAGSKIKLLKDSLHYIVDTLTEQDRMCIIRFDFSSHILSSLLKMTNDNKRTLKVLIDDLKASGGTNIIGALEAAFTVLGSKQYKNNLQSIFLLSDGLDGGNQQTGLLFNIASATGFNSNARLQKSSLETTYFKFEEILRKRAPTFTIHTFGYGEDHDSQLMIDIAKLRDGSFNYISKLEVLKEKIAACLGGLFTVVASSIAIRVKKTHPTLKNITPFGSEIKYDGHLSEVDQFEIELTQVLEETRKNFVFMLRIPPALVSQQIKDVDRDQQILVAEASLTPVEGSVYQPRQLKTKLSLKFYSSQEEVGDVQIDNEVLEQYWRIKSLHAWDESQKLLQKGKIAQAQTTMANFRLQMNQLPNYMNSSMLQSIDRDMLRIDEKLKDNRKDRAQKMIKHKRRERSRERECHRNQCQERMVRMVVEDRGYSVSNDSD